MRIPISNESFRAYNKKSKNLKKSLFRLDVWGTNPSRGRWISEASLVYRGITKQLGATEALTQPPPPPTTSSSPTPKSNPPYLTESWSLQAAPKPS